MLTRRALWPPAAAAATATTMMMLLLFTAAPGCSCGPPQRIEQTMAEVVVVVDVDRVAFSRGGRALLDVRASRVGAKTVAASYEMQFGMFDIVEQPAAFAFGERIELGDVTPERVAFTIFGAGDVAFADGAVSIAGEAVELAIAARDEAANAVLVASACPFSHAIGLGAQSHDVDHFGQIVPLWVSEPGVGKTDDDELPVLWQLVGRRHTTSAPVPAFIADNSAAYVFDASAFARIDLCSDVGGGEATFEAWQPAVALRVYAGDSPADAQRKMVAAFGRPPVPPPWTFAPWNDAIFGEQNVRDIAQRLRDLDIPSSAIWTEDWRGGADAGGGLYRLDEDWGVDAALYPDFPGLVSDLNALGLQSMVYFNTFVVEGADVFADVTEGGLAIKTASGAGPSGAFLFTGPDREFSPTTLADLTNPDARAFVKEYLQRALDAGAGGWMADFGEWLPVDDVALASGEDPALVHNRYPVLWQEVNREILEENGALGGDFGAVVFVRAAHLGSQPLAQVIWAGDQRTTFDVDDGLPTVLPLCIGLSTVGFPFVTHDVGGYQSSTNDPGDKELFMRWTSLGAFSPIMRTHHGTHATLNVNLFTDDETIAHWKRYAELHIRLYPYLRALSLDEASASLWRALPLQFSSDDAVWALKDEVMLGPSLLVAPIVDKGLVARDVVFPSARFASFPGALARVTVVDGPAVVGVEAGLDEIPVFIVAGGIVPMTAFAADTLLPSVGGLDGIESTQGDRVVVVGLGASGFFAEEGGASYTLEGAGTDAPASEEPDRAVIVVGDDVIEGDGFSFALVGHPASRTTRVIFR